MENGNPAVWESVGVAEEKDREEEWAKTTAQVTAGDEYSCSFRCYSKL